MTVAELTQLPEMLAPNPGRCGFCHERYPATEPIAKDPRLGWGHSDCMHGYRRTIDEHTDTDGVDDASEENQ